MAANKKNGKDKTPIEPEEHQQSQSSGEEDFKNVNREGEYDNINAEEVIPSAGSKPNIVGDASKLNRPSPKAHHPGQTINIDEEQQQQQQFSGEFQQGGNNPHMDNQPNSNEQHDFNQGFQEEEPEIPAAEDDLSTADFIHRNLLKKGIQQLPNLLTIGKKKIEKLHEKGEINVNLVVPKNAIDRTPITIYQAVNDFNEDIKTPFDVSEEWIQANNPLLARIIAKKGAALSPEAQYGINLGMLGVQIGINCYQVLQARGSFLDGLKNFNKEYQSQQQQQTYNNNTASSASADQQPQANASNADIPKGKDAEKAIKAIVKKNVSSKSKKDLKTGTIESATPAK